MTQKELIRQEIERMIMSVNPYAPEYDDVESAAISGGQSALRQLRTFIDSLPEEKATCKTCGFYENNCPFIRGKLIPYPNKVCKDYTYSTMKEQEKPSDDLEEEIQMEWDSFNKHIAKYSEGTDEVVWLNWLSFVDIANYFYEIGLNAKEDKK